jgi:hypothetical protein
VPRLKPRNYPIANLRSYIYVLLLLICVVILSQQLANLSAFIDFDVDDFIEYWSASVLHLQGQNPYDRDLLTPLQNQAGRYRDVPVIMWNPPWTLALVLPFGLLDFSTARLLWFLIHLGILFACSSWLWQYFGGSKHSLWVAWLFALTFAPSLMMLKVGQISGFFLLGVVGFLYFEKNNKDLFAGGSAALLMIKPHVGYLIIVILALWAVHKKKWLILLGGTLALAGSTLVVWLIHPSALRDYYYAAVNYPPVAWATPTIGGFFRYFIGVDLFWLQLLPPGFGLVWILYYYYKHHTYWKWEDQISLICLVSIVTAAYGWIYDQVLVLVAVIQIALIIRKSNNHIYSFALIFAYAAVNILILLLDLSQFWFFWFAPCMLLIYLVVEKILKTDSSMETG